jgi:outer membrane immunogenic protein
VEKEMKKVLLGALGLLALAAGPAAAADLPAKVYTKAPAVVPIPIYNWGGFYIGANAGYGWNRRCLDITAVNSLGVFDAEGCRNSGGGVVGGQIGYRWQMTNWVFGLEAMGDWANLRNSNQSLFFTSGGFPDTWTSKTTALGLFTGQVGYAWNNVLWYVKGGAAVANQRWDLFNNFTNVGIFSTERTRWGGTVGTGIEYGFAPNWSVALEYDYIWRTNYSATYVVPTGILANGVAVNAFSANTRSDINLITARINYHFNWGSPVVARY